MKRLGYDVLAILGCGIFGATVTATINHYHHHDAPHVCVAGPNEVCPSDAFIKDYDNLKSLQADLNQRLESDAVKKVVEEQDEINGGVQRLSKLVPQGYTFNEDKLKFVAVP